MKGGAVVIHHCERFAGVFTRHCGDASDSDQAWSKERAGTQPPNNAVKSGKTIQSEKPIQRNRVG
jgi:hypothetical protein